MVRSTRWPPPVAAKPAVRSRLPPTDLPASADQRDRSGNRPVSDPSTRPPAKVIRRSPAIVLSAAVRRRLLIARPVFPIGAAASPSWPSSRPARKLPSIVAFGCDKSATTPESCTRSTVAPSAAMPRPSSWVCSCNRSSGPSATALPETEPTILAPTAAFSFSSRGMSKASAAVKWFEAGSNRTSPPSLPAALVSVKSSAETVPASSRRIVPASDGAGPSRALAATTPVCKSVAEPAIFTAPTGPPPSSTRCPAAFNSTPPLFSSSRVKSSARVSRSTFPVNDHSICWPNRAANAPPLDNASWFSRPRPATAMRVCGSSSAPLGVNAIWAATVFVLAPETSTSDAARSAARTGRCFVPLISALNTADPPRPVLAIVASFAKSGSSARK